MQYRRFGKLDWRVSALGFGAMRLPLTGRDPASVDEYESIRMIRYAVDHGVNYIDTAYPYHAGRSEPVVAMALRDGYRGRVKLATKLYVRVVESATDFDRLLDEQLERLQSKIDFYLLHGLNNDSWARVRDLGVLRWAERAMADGRFDYLGFSFHDEFDVFKEIVDVYDNWTMCQIQYNYMDVDYQAGRRGLKYAASKGLAVVVMEPLRGGQLAKEPPEEVAKVWASAGQLRSPAEWGLLWVLDHSEVAVVLSGMSTIEQVAENVTVAGGAGPGILGTHELALFDQAREAYRRLSPVPCTGCGYCMPCPSGVQIPTILNIYNEAVMYDDPRTGRFRYRGPAGLPEGERADQCIECEECVDACPQAIPIPEWLRKAHELLGPRQ
ncbi:MAG: aldo/keto reductase [Chloroflexota bacterium]|nr:aldo/keto reductase [Chloroflexota bacterium]